MRNTKKILNLFYAGLVFSITLSISACNVKSTVRFELNENGATAEASAAERLRIEKTGAYYKLTIINPWQGAQNVIQVFYLIKRGNIVPEGIDSSTVIFVPVKNIICMSTSYIAMINAIGESNSISAVSGPELIFDMDLRIKAENGDIADIGYESNLNKELVLSINPDLIMMYGIGNESAGYIGKISELGIKVLYNADYLEDDPLKKAEWIKLFGVLYCKEELADSLYNSEVKAYNDIRNTVIENIKNRPKVLLGLPFKDTWYISPGNSYISRLIEDAGGEYLWKDTESDQAMPFGIENVYVEALNADYWLNIGTISSKKELSVVDRRLEELPCYKNDRLYNNNKRITASGGNDYWESATVYPHLILQDIAKILHPDIFKSKETYYYNKIN